jgi:hypothetical protein
MQTMTYNTTKLRFNSKILLALGVLLSASTASYACDSCQIMLAAQQHQTFQTHIYKSMNDSNAKRHRDGSNSAERSTSKAQPNSNAARQTFFEQLTYPLFVEKAKYADYLKQGNTATLSKMAASTQDGFKKLGLDLQNLQLTSRGLAPL